MPFMEHKDLKRDDLAVFATYGRTMASVQEFEAAVTRLARLNFPQLPEDGPFARAWKRMKRHLNKSDTPLAEILSENGNTPGEMLDRIEYLLTGRKNLAHEFLLGYVLENNIGTLDRAKQESILREAEADFLVWRDSIDALCVALAERLGVTPENANLALDDIRNEFGHDDVHAMLSAYGTAMHAVQLWELSVKGLLVNLELPGDDEEADFEETWKAVELILTTAAGPLRRQLEARGYAPEGLHADLETFRERRNELAHRFFLDYSQMRARGQTGVRTAALSMLAAMETWFTEQHAKMDALADTEAFRRGWDTDDLGGLTPDELRRIVRDEDEPEED